MKDIHSFVILAYNESDNLEECIKSIKNQSVKSNVVIATSTKNNYIIDLASEYGLGVIVNDEPSNKGRDYNFALRSMQTKLVTIVHQDDLYDRNYAKKVIECYKHSQDASIIFTNYYEIVVDHKVKFSFNLFNRRLLLWFLKYNFFNKCKYFKKLILKYYNCICSSSVTFIKDNIPDNIFPIDLECNNDWAGFIKLSNDDFRFVYIKDKLVGYRRNEEAHFDKSDEDKIILKNFWNESLIDFFYRHK